MDEKITSEKYYDTLLTTARAEMNTRMFVMVAGALGIGTDAFEGNLARMKSQIAKLESDGYQVFDQTPYLDIYHDDAPRDYAKKFEIFYKGIIQSGSITKLFVLPDFEQSLGVISEINYAQEKGVPVEYLQ